MLGARSARLGDALLQGLAGPEHSNAGMVCGQSARGRERLDRHALQIDRLECVGVLGLQCPCEPADTGADLGVDLGFGSLARFQLPCKCLERAASNAAPAESIDRRIAKRAVEPRREAFISGRLVRTLD